ncbi:sugar isomerase (SIS) [Candidatus Korarchaeum cryptofilum OPF8]|uniref:Sugar isomerase (SIS) n=2 Tax=Candidatus Korarchaeum cryptofilum TaxID=498846 RepID=B1L7C4_KORCO|nr:sugar isomerase (SIS) [Candidatus Korarchaeum cryptofilum OPF8]
MMGTPVVEKIGKLIEVVKENLSTVDDESANMFIKALFRTMGEGKIFVVGAGRSGLVAKAFAMRLLHVGFQVYVVGETVTPSMRSGDLLIAVSGSGETKFPVTAAQVAKSVGAHVIAITSYPDSTLGKIADFVVRIGGRVLPEDESRDYFTRQILGIHEPLTPLGTLFELSAMIYLDALISEIVELMGKSEEDLARRHANIE